MTGKPKTYEGSGVSYAAMDPFKRDAQKAGRKTSGNITRLNNGEFREVEMSRGESAFLIEAADCYLAHVEEGLGTKNLIADAMYTMTGKSYYDDVAQDTVAMIVNDMVTLGALPLSVAMHLAVGSGSWFDKGYLSSDVVEGWRRACDMAGAIYGGGETPTLRGIINPGTVVLAGSAMGIIKPKSRLITADNIRDDDAIIFIRSSGVHANGLTLAREIASKVPGGYTARLSDGRLFGAALLDPTRIYVRDVEAVLDAGIPIHYTANITGHGWRKLMRAVEPFVYVIQQIPEPQPVFGFIAEHGPVDQREMYGNYNMGVGFALYVDQADADRVVELIPDSYVAGYVQQRGDDKKVIIEPLGIEYHGSTLAVR